jgi:peptide/nickel transport system substrate-binding protein
MENRNRFEFLFRQRRTHLVALAISTCLGLWLTLGLLHGGAVARAEQAESPTFAPAARESQPTGTFTFALSSPAGGLDSATMDWDQTMLVTAQIYETLVNYQSGGTLPVPGLARSWTVSTDGLTWTFHLQTGVTFQDGTAMDANAVVCNLNRWWDPAHPQHSAGFMFPYMFGGFKGEPGCWIAAVSASAADEVQIVLTRPDSRLPILLATPWFAIASPTAIQAGTLVTAPVGSGPFRFVERSGDTIRLTANPSYWGDGPRLAKLVFAVIGDADARLAALRSDTVQGASEWTADSLAQALAEPELKVLWKPYLWFGYLGINRAHAPLDNPLVRQAIAHALNKHGLVSELYNASAPVAQVAGQLLPQGILGYDPNLQDYAYVAAQARALLAQADYTQGLTTTLWFMPVRRPYFPVPAEIGASMQADLQAVGITATLVTDEWSGYLNKVANGEADLFMLGWLADYGHPHSYLYDILCSGISFGPPDDVLCHELSTALTETDPEQQLAFYHWASQRVHDTLPLVPIAHAREAVIVRRNVMGAQPAAFYAASLKDVYLSFPVYLPVVVKKPS